MRIQALALLASLLCSTVGHADTLQLAPVADNTLYDDGANGQLSNGLGVGVFSGVTNAGNVRRALLRFDLAAIPAGSTVTSATLQLRITQTIAGPAATTLHRVLGAWGEGASGGFGAGGNGALSADCDATWLHRHFPGATCADQRWATPGGDFVSAPSAAAFAGNLGTNVSFSGPSLTLDVQAMVDGVVPNDGWLVRHVDELTGITAKRFGSREAPNALDRPVLTVEYTPPLQQVFCVPAQPNSVSVVGSSVALQGSGSLAQNDNSLVVSQCPDFVGLFIQGNTSTAATPTPFGGTLCLGGAIGRFSTRVASQGTAAQALDFAGTGVEGVVLAGETWFYQWVHRDTTQGGGNVSAGLAVTWAP